MNRLRTGVVLQIPAREAIEAIPAAEARRALRTQTSEWQSYRRKLTGVPVIPAQEPPARASGTVRPATEPVVPSAPGGDRVQVSRSGTGKGAADEDLIARDKALKDSQERVAILEKNVEDLKRLLDAQNRTLADLEKRAKEVAENKKKSDTVNAPVAPATDPVPTPAPSTEPAVPPALSGSEPPPVENPLEVVGSSSLLPQPESVLSESTSAIVPAPVEMTPPEPVAQPEPQPTVVPDEDEFSEEDEGGSGLLWGGIGALVVVLAGAGFVLMRRRKNTTKAIDTAGIAPSADGVSALEDEALLLNESHSIFQETGGQSVDTSTEDPATSGFSSFTKGTGTFEAGDVDPVNEADLYLGYGKDEQAEEILLDALQKEPHRLAISLKLLEIYALRKNVKQFDALAADVHAQTGGIGTDWEKVAALGLEVNPANPLYGEMVSTPEAAFEEQPASFEETAFGETTFGETEFTTAVSQQTGSSLDYAFAEETEMGLADGATEEPDSSSTATEIEPPPSFENTQTEGTAFSTSVPSTEPASESFMPANQQETTSVVTATDFDLSFEGDAETGEGDFDFSATTGDIQAAMQAEEEDQPLVEIPDLTPPPPPPPVVEPVAAPPAFEPEEPEPLDVSVLDADTVLGPDSLVPDVTFDANLTKSTVLEGITDSPFAGIDLDLDTPPQELAEALEIPREATVPAPASGDESSRAEIDTKLELAQAYEDMGDLEGARELLGEVLNEGAPDQVEQAKAILERLGG
jgi:pilus assembly protein FimV